LGGKVALWASWHCGQCVVMNAPSYEAELMNGINKVPGTFNV